MSQHTLYGTQVGASFQQVCRKRMAEGMRTDFFFQTDALCQFLDDMENHDAGDVLPEIADEDKIFKSRLYFHQVTVGEVESDLLGGTR